MKSFTAGESILSVNFKGYESQVSVNNKLSIIIDISKLYRIESVKRVLEPPTHTKVFFPFKFILSAAAQAGALLKSDSSRQVCQAGCVW